MKSLVLPRSVRKVGENAFKENKYLQKVILGTDTEVLLKSCFESSNIRVIDLSESLRIIEDMTFKNCQVLTGINLKSGLQIIGSFSFAGAGIQQLTVPSSVEKLNQGAFFDCCQLRSVKFNKGENLDFSQFSVYFTGIFEHSAVQSIDLQCQIDIIPPNCFKDCNYLETVILPEGVQRITQSCFQNSSVQTVQLLRTLTDIDEDAFLECKHLTNINFPEKTVLERIGFRAFQGTGLGKLVLPPSIRTIEQAAFCNCQQLVEVQLNEGLECLGTNSFQDCGKEYRGVFENSAVQTIVLPSTLKKIEYIAFKECTHLSEITLNDGLQIIGRDAFLKSNLQQIKIPKTVQKIGTGAFYNCARFNSIQFERSIQCIGTGDANLQTRGTFEGTQLQSINIPLGVKIISANLLRNCKNLSTVLLPEGLMSIKSYWLQGACVSSITIPSTVIEICQYAFQNNTSLVNVQFTESSQLQKIGFCAFQSTGLQSFKVLNSVREIAQGAFNICKYLKNVVLNERLECLGNDDPISGDDSLGAFSTSGLNNIILPSSLKVIKHRTFYECSNLQQINLQQNIKCIEHYCFMKSGLYQIVIPDSIETIEQGAFAQCQNLRSVILGKNLQYLGSDYKDWSGVFQQSAIEYVELPPSLKTLACKCFNMCQAFKIVLLSEGLEIIGTSCFAGLSIQQIGISTTVKEIQNGAFQDCQSLTSVSFTKQSQLQKIGNTAFMNSALRLFTVLNTVEFVANNVFNNCNIRMCGKQLNIQTNQGNNRNAGGFH